MNRFALQAFVRPAGAASLLMMLAICSFAGTSEPAKTVSVPMERVVLSGEQMSACSMENTRQRLRSERERELALLDSVADHPAAEQETRRNALEQKTSIALRMEQEAAIEAALSYMGFGDTAVICGAQEVTVFAPVSEAGEEKNRIRMIDAAVSHGGVSPDDVRIILAKK